MKGLWACALVTASLCYVTAQQPAPASPARVTVVVNDATAPPDWETRLPLSLVLADGTDTGRITMKLGYPAKILRFERIERAEGLEKTGIEIKATATPPAKDADTGTVTVEIGTGKGATSIPSGVLGNAVFKVIYTEPDPLAVGAEEAAKAAQQDKFPVTAESVQAFGIAAPFAPLSATGRAATFTIAPGGLPIFACFFYMH